MGSAGRWRWQSRPRVTRAGSGFWQRLLIVETSGTAGLAGTRSFQRRLGFRRGAGRRDVHSAGDDKVIFTRRLAE